VIKTDLISANVLKIIAPHKLQADDFLELGPEVDSLIAKRGKIRLLIDASKLDGWANAEAAEKHMQFVKEHQKRVERIAIIIQHEWQHWFVAPSGSFYILKSRHRQGARSRSDAMDNPLTQ
jgi:hypothetical protein